MLRTTRIRRQSGKQRKRDTLWRKVTAKRIADVGGVCELFNWISSATGPELLAMPKPVPWPFPKEATEGHHKLHRRFGDDSYENCCVLSKSAHAYIEAHSEWAYAHGFSIRGNGTPLRKTGGTP